MNLDTKQGMEQDNVQPNNTPEWGSLWADYYPNLGHPKFSKGQPVKDSLSQQTFTADKLIPMNMGIMQCSWAYAPEGSNMFIAENDLAPAGDK